MRLPIHAAAALSAMTLWTPAALAQAAPAAKPDPVVLIKQVTGKDADKLKDFLVDQGAASVSAAALAGVTSALTTVQDTKDFAVLVNPFDKDGKGGGFSIAPARVRNPLPRIDLMSQYVQSGWWRAVGAINISGAQGLSQVGGKDVRRRAFAVGTNAYFFADDDPIVQRANASLMQKDAVGNEPVPVTDSCLAGFYKVIDATDGTLTGADTGVAGMTAKELQQAKEKALADALTAATPVYKACVEKVYANARNKWFSPRWSFAYGTGDAQDKTSGNSARIGDTVAVGITYGRPWQVKRPAKGETGGDTVLSGWAITVLGRVTRDELVLSSLANGTPQRQNTSLLAGRLAIGTETWRLLGEVSNNDVKKTQGGERTMKQALGLDYRVAKESWLVLRYGKRVKSIGTGEEGAALLSVTIGGDLLPF